MGNSFYVRSTTILIVLEGAASILACARTSATTSTSARERAACVRVRCAGQAPGKLLLLSPSPSPSPSPPPSPSPFACPLSLILFASAPADGKCVGAHVAQLCAVRAACLDTRCTMHDARCTLHDARRFRLLTFAVNALIVRKTSTEILGIVNVR